MLVRPMMMAPAARSRSTATASRVAAGALASTFEPARVTWPASSKLSLTDMGTPASAGSVAPRLCSASTRSEPARADSRCTFKKARAPSPSGDAMAASARSTSSRLVILRAVRSLRSADVPPLPQRRAFTRLVELEYEYAIELDGRAARLQAELRRPVCNARVALHGDHLRFEMNVALIGGHPAPVFLDARTAFLGRIERHLEVVSVDGEEAAGSRRVAHFPGGAIT